MQIATATANATERPADHKDNLFGVCAALGEDFGFDPLWLRLALGLGLIVNFAAVVAGYFVLGAIVLVSRLAFPNRPAVTTTDARRPVLATTSQDLAAVAIARAA